MQFTGRLSIPYPDLNGDDTPVDLPQLFHDRAVILDGLAHTDTGPLSSRPVSTSGSPGKAGRFFTVTDQPDSPRLDLDIGTAWITVGPARVDAAPNIASLRTLGTGHQQACAGDDPRLIDGAIASGDLSGSYPGPITVNSWNGQSKGAVVAGSPPQAHGGSHAPSSTDPVSGLTYVSFALSGIDPAAGVPGLRTLGNGAQQAMPGNSTPPPAPHAATHTNGGSDYVHGLPPIGVCVPYTGSGDPTDGAGEWVVADGRLIDRSIYLAFFNKTGHSYNGGIDPGSNMVRIPDKRGKSSIGAINMGTNAGLNDNAHHQAVRGTSYGEVVHQLTARESGQNDLAAMGTESVDHTHSGTTASESANHAHNINALTTVNSAATAGPAAFLSVTAQTRTTETENATHVHAFSTGGRSVGHVHAMTARNADLSHNNISPSEADSYIVRIA